MSSVCDDVLIVEDVLCFGDIRDVLKNSIKREKSCGGTIIFTTINGAQFIPGEYMVQYLNEYTLIVCLNTVDPVKVREYMMTTDCSNFRDPHLINRYDWKRLKYGCDSEPSSLMHYLREGENIEVEESLLKKLQETLGDEYESWTYVTKGDGNLNCFSEDDVKLVKVEPKAELAPKKFFMIKNALDDAVIGFVYKMALQGDHEYGALLEDKASGRHFALILSEEHVNNSLDKTIEELNKCCPMTFTGLVSIGNFLK